MTPSSSDTDAQQQQQQQQPSTTAAASSSSSSRETTDTSTADGEGSASSSTSASTATLPDPQQHAQTLFTRLQSSLPPDLLTGLRDTIPEGVRDAQARRELAQVAQARVQGAAARGEELLRGASVFLRDAVRVVPPEEQASDDDAAHASHSSRASTTTTTSSATQHEKSTTPTPNVNVNAVVSSSTSTLTPATRRGALLRALRENPSILRVDPKREERSAALFALWVERIGAEASRDGSRRESELGADDGALRSTHSALGE
jgi:hypothetical protein